MVRQRDRGLFGRRRDGLLLEHWLPGSDLAFIDIPELVGDHYLDGAARR